MTDSTSPGQRFVQLIQQLGLSKNAFAQSLGKTATVIQHLVDERNKPGFDLLSKVLEVYPTVSSDWLLLGRGPMLRAETPVRLADEAAPSEPNPPQRGGIDLDEIPDAPRRRNGNLLQSADIAATLRLAGQPRNGSSHGHAVSVAPAKPVAVGAPRPVVAASPAAAPAATEPAPLPTAAPASAPVQASAPPTPAWPAPAPPDPAYLAALLQAQQLQHQLALAEQRNQHLLEQQALLQQMVELLRNR
ncbi:helix-turn-helix transcriptional regulator [Hymenobacter sp. RP-2-7]|uniref:Helix-turn-helix transcriptional regulator n=1 Tax=Hymenobacter polaris TaxID=2682546 RepID=A0A7Y0FL50_9BACT|nr:helix-turn-helix transcriptional regulator [Hymenobacter polaris]NML64438.1 helix-turn-helix transcriptional regulator [Hymenobacter polaris]